jgi:hypothetical protein
MRISFARSEERDEDVEKARAVARDAVAERIAENIVK